MDYLKKYVAFYWSLKAYILNENLIYAGGLKFWSSGDDEVVEGVFSLGLVLEAFILEENVQMPWKVVIDGRDV